MNSSRAFRIPILATATAIGLAAAIAVGLVERGHSRAYKETEHHDL